MFLAMNAWSVLSDFTKIAVVPQIVQCVPLELPLSAPHQMTVRLAKVLLVFWCYLFIILG